MDHLSLFHKKIEKNIKQNYPQINLSSDSYKNIFSPNIIHLKQQTVLQIKDFIKAAFHLTNHTAYKNILIENQPDVAPYINRECNNYSLLMSYDFHIQDDVAKLIEINTNASSFLIGNTVSEVLQNKNYISNLKNSFEEEISLSNVPVKNIAIIDDKPEEQNLFIEFQMYKTLLEKWGYNCSILDTKELTYKDNKIFDTSGQPIDFIYNRYCDFYLANDESAQLLESYKKNQVLLSPQPTQYFLLADKQRMIDWQNSQLSNWLNQEQVAIIDKTLLKTKDIQEFDSSELWANKKQFFFKPKKSFGGKSVYRGKGVTKKVFERLLAADTLVQEYVPAPTITNGEQKWKYDLRVYCYKDNVDQIVARTYQGQTTNASTLGGGISIVKVDS